MTEYQEGSATVLLKTGVFLNPAQVYNRDISVSVLKTFSQQTQSPVSILEPLAATGIRSIRYYKEIGCQVERITANDWNPEAVQEMQHNFEINDIQADVRQMDAIGLLYESRSNPYDIVDLDPYGSVSSFLDGAVQAVKDNGLLCITSTDMTVLCGNHQDTAFYKYGSITTNAKYQHESALRSILFALRACANKYQKSIIPLVSLSIDFYVRVFVKVVNSAQKASKSLEQTFLVFQCSQCPVFHLHWLGRPKGKRACSNYFQVGANCNQCGGEFLVEGPLYGGDLHDKEFVKKMHEVVKNSELQSKLRIIGMLNSVAEEITTPLYYNISMLCKAFQCLMMSNIKLRTAVRALGGKISQSHTDCRNYKIDLSVDQIFDIIRYWRQQVVTQERWFNKVKEGSVTHTLISRSPQISQLNFDEQPNESDLSFELLPKYIPPPKSHWGPAKRAQRTSNREKQPEKKVNTDNFNSSQMSSPRKNKPYSPVRSYIDYGRKSSPVKYMNIADLEIFQRQQMPASKINQAQESPNNSKRRNVVDRVIQRQGSSPQPQIGNNSPLKFQGSDFGEFVQSNMTESVHSVRSQIDHYKNLYEQTREQNMNHGAGELYGEIQKLKERVDSIETTQMKILEFVEKICRNYSVDQYQNDLPIQNLFFDFDLTAGVLGAYYLDDRQGKGIVSSLTCDFDIGRDYLTDDTEVIEFMPSFL